MSDDSQARQTAEVLFANETFYQVFRSRDLVGMGAIWAQGDPLVCIHPGWPALIGRREIMESWDGILSRTDSPQVACQGAQVFPAGVYALVVCYERIGSTLLVATNAFRREGGAWRMAHHHAGPCNFAPENMPETHIPEAVQ